MADKRLEWFPLYYERFLLATIEWSTVEIGAYFLLLCHQWDKGWVPNNPTDIRKITRTHYRVDLQRVLNKFSILPQSTSEGGSITPERIVNETLLLIRIKQENKSKTNSESGSKGGKARAANEANARETLKNLEQNRTEQNKRESTHTHSNEETESQKGSGQAGETKVPAYAKSSELSAHKPGPAPASLPSRHWERLKQSPAQLEAFTMSARKLGIFSSTMQAQDCIDSMIRIAKEYYEGEFLQVAPEADYKIFGYKLTDHLKKMAQDPNRKPWDQPKQTSLNYHLPVNPNA